jgi:hypothetical protein
MALPHATNAASLLSFPLRGERVSTIAGEIVSEAGTTAVISNKHTLCSGLDVLPVFGNESISVTILARTVSSPQRRRIMRMSSTDLARVSAFADLDEDSAAETSFPGKTGVISWGHAESRSAVTDVQCHQ